MNETTEAATVIKMRLKSLGLSQASFSLKAGKSGGWAGARFFPNVERTIQYLDYAEPKTLKRMLEVLGWSADEFSIFTGIKIPKKEIKLTSPLLAPATKEELEKAVRMARELLAMVEKMKDGLFGPEDEE